MPMESIIEKGYQNVLHIRRGGVSHTHTTKVSQEFELETTYVS